MEIPYQAGLEQDSAWENPFGNDFCAALSSLVHDQLEEKSCLGLNLRKQQKLPHFRLLGKGFLCSLERWK